MELYYPRTDRGPRVPRLMELVYVIAWLGVKFGINTTSIVVGMENFCHSHYNTCGIYPKFHSQPCYYIY